MIYVNSLEQKKAFTLEKSLTPIGLVWNTNIVTALLFCKTNTAAVTSCENAQSCFPFSLMRLYYIIRNSTAFHVNK